MASSTLIHLILALHVILITAQNVNSAMVPRKNFRFPQQLRIINHYDDDSFNTNSNSISRPGIVNTQMNVMSQSQNQNNPNPNYGIPSQINNNNNNNAPPQPIRECVCPCTREYLPICGSDSKTYGNNCLFQCQRNCDLRLKFHACGTCEEPSGPEDKLPCL